MLTVCLTRRSHSQKPMIVSTLSSRTKSLSTFVLSIALAHCPGGASSSSGQRGLATILGGEADRPSRAGTSPRTRSSRRCPCTAPASDSTRERRAREPSSARLARSARFAPTPPATIKALRDPVASSAVTALGGQRVDDGGLKRSRDVGPHCVVEAPCVGAARLDRESRRRLQPAEAEVEALILERARQSETLRLRRASASAASCGPPGYGSPSSRATLSNASPAASSSVSPTIR